MSFYISLSGLKAAQTDLTVTANNVANVGSNAFKKSKASFGDIFASSPMQGSNATGQGVRLQGVTQQFTQGTLETTDKTLDLALAGEGFFAVQLPPPSDTRSFTRNGSFGVDQDRYVVDTTGARMLVYPTDETTGEVTSTDEADLVPLQIFTTKDNDPAGSQLAGVSISDTGLVAATYADGSIEYLGAVAVANFPSQEGLKQIGDAHWIPSGDSGEAFYGEANSGLFGAIRSGTLERSNVDITEELVAMIAAQRNYQANAKAIETANTLTQTITNMRT